MPPGSKAEKVTFRILELTSVSFWMLKTKMPSLAVESTVATPSTNRDRRGERNLSWDMFSSRTVILLVSMSSVMMVTRRVQTAVTLWTPSEGKRERDNGEVREQASTYGQGGSHSLLEINRPVRHFGAPGPEREMYPPSAVTTNAFTQETKTKFLKDCNSKDQGHLKEPRTRGECPRQMTASASEQMDVLTATGQSKGSQGEGASPDSN